MNCNEMETLIKLVEKSSLKEFYYKTEAEEIRLVRQEPPAPVVLQAPAGVPAPVPVSFAAAPAPAAAPAAGAAEDANWLRVRSPYVGTINLNNENGKAYVSEGDTVKKGQLLCRIEAMKMLSDLNSPADGILRKVLVKDGDMVEFDAELFMIEEQ